MLIQGDEAIPGGRTPGGSLTERPELPEPKRKKRTINSGDPRSPAEIAHWEWMDAESNKVMAIRVRKLFRKLRRDLTQIEPAE